MEVYRAIWIGGNMSMTVSLYAYLNELLLKKKQKNKINLLLKIMSLVDLVY